MLKRSVQVLKRSGWALALCLILVAGLGMSEESLAVSSKGSSIQVYKQSDVDCDNPQYAPLDPRDLPMSFYEEEDGDKDITLYVCSKGTNANVQLYAEAAGISVGIHAYLECKLQGSCGDFEKILPEKHGGTGFPCRHQYLDYEDTVYLPEGLYRIYVFAGHRNGSCAGYHTGLLDIYPADGLWPTPTNPPE